MVPQGVAFGTVARACTTWKKWRGGEEIEMRESVQSNKQTRPNLNVTP